PELALLLLELDQLESRTPDVETHQTLRAREQHDAIYPLSSELADRTFTSDSCRQGTSNPKRCQAVGATAAQIHVQYCTTRFFALAAAAGPAGCGIPALRLEFPGSLGRAGIGSTHQILPESHHGEAVRSLR